MDQRKVCVFGGSGFLGRYVVARLLKAGYMVKAVSRTPERALYLRTAGSVGQLAIVEGNIKNDESIKKAIERCDAVINCVGILYETGSQKFSQIHALAAEKIAKAAKSTGIQRLVHISAIGSDRAVKSEYARTKLNGEKAVLASFPEATIIRPSIIFGPEDSFFNLFAGLAKLFHVMPLIEHGKTKFQPVYVGDIAEATVRILEKSDSQGKIYELGGPKVYSFREIMEYIKKVTDIKAAYIYLPFSIAKIIGSISAVFPKPLLTLDQVRLLQTDNIVLETENNFYSLGIKPVSIEEIVPTYLGRYKYR